MELNHTLNRLCRSTTEPSVNLTHYLNTINIILKSHIIRISRWLVINARFIIKFILIKFILFDFFLLIIDELFINFLLDLI